MARWDTPFAAGWRHDRAYGVAQNKPSTPDSSNELCHWHVVNSLLRRTFWRRFRISPYLLLSSQAWAGNGHCVPVASFSSVCVRVLFLSAKNASRQRITRSHIVNIDPAASKRERGTWEAHCCWLLPCSWTVIWKFSHSVHTLTIKFLKAISLLPAQV